MSYKTLDSTYELLEISPCTRCRGGDYLMQSNPELIKYCNTIKDNCSCDKLHRKGVPYKFEYTPLSNHNWQNERVIIEYQNKK
jgi:hypothetical protein